FAQASIADRESSAPSCTKPSREGPVHRCSLFSFHWSSSSGAISDHSEAVHDPEFPPNLGEAEISPSVLPEATSETRTERSNSGFDSCRRRNEAAQSRLGMSAYRCTDQLAVWGPY